MATNKSDEKVVWTETKPGNRTEPAAAVRSDGYANEDVLPSEELNHLLYAAGDNIDRFRRSVAYYDHIHDFLTDPDIEPGDYGILRPEAETALYAPSTLPLQNYKALLSGKESTAAKGVVDSDGQWVVHGKDDSLRIYETDDLTTYSSVTYTGYTVEDVSVVEGGAAVALSDGSDSYIDVIGDLSNVGALNPIQYTSNPFEPRVLGTGNSADPFNINPNAAWLAYNGGDSVVYAFDETSTQQWSATLPAGSFPTTQTAAVATNVYGVFATAGGDYYRLDLSNQTFEPDAIISSQELLDNQPSVGTNGVELFVLLKDTGGDDTFYSYDFSGNARTRLLYDTGGGVTATKFDIVGSGNGYFSIWPGGEFVIFDTSRMSADGSFGVPPLKQYLDLLTDANTSDVCITPSDIFVMEDSGDGSNDFYRLPSQWSRQIVFRPPIINETIAKAPYPATGQGAMIPPNL